MPQDVTKKVAITFGAGLPCGTRGTFTHERQRWIALPATKYVRLLTIADRLVGALAVQQREMTAWLAAHPDDAQRVGMLLAAIARTDALRAELAVEKCVAATA